MHERCQSCGTTTTSGYTLCPACELHTGLLLLQLAADVTPLHDSLDATLHPGGHSPIRIQTATPPTPIRLDVLDILDLLDTTAGELLHRLDGIDAHPDTPIPITRDLTDTLTQCARHPRLPRLPDIGMYHHQLTGLATLIDRTLDPPEERQPIGICPDCATPLTAGTRDQWVTCPTCNREQRVLTVKLKRLERLCFDTTHTGTAAQIATTFTNSGITLKRNTINQWAKRQRITPTARVDGKPVYLYSDIYRLTIAPEA